MSQYPASSGGEYCLPAFGMAQLKLRRDLVRLCRELGLTPDSVRAGKRTHLKVYSPAGRLLTTVASTPRSHDDALTMARRDIEKGLRRP
jgi:hypothetical protein